MRWPESDPMSPTPRTLHSTLQGPLSRPGPRPGSEGLAESAAGSTGSGSGAGSSFATSLAVHGLALATLVMTVKLPWRGSSEEPERIIACAIEPAVAPASARDDREPPLEINAPGWESEPLIIDDFDLPEEPAFEDAAWADDDMPAYRPPVREIDPYAEPTLDLTPKARPKLVRPRSLPKGAVPGPLPELNGAPVAPPTPRDAQANTSPEPVEGACPPPIFPKIAQLRGWSGTVYLWIDVSASGTVTDVRIDTSSGHKILDEAAMKAVRDWRFTPAVSAGVRTSVTVRKPIEFSLGGA